MIKTLKKFLVPRSIWARFMMIIVLPAIIIQLATAYVFYERHWKDVSMYLEKSVLGEIKLLDRLMRDSRFKKSEVSYLAQKYLQIKNYPAKKIDDNNDPKFESLRKEFSKIADNLRISQDNERDDIKIGITNSKYSYVFEVPRKRLFTPTINIFIAWVFGVSSLVIIVALIFTRNQVKSIERLSEAAKIFGEGGDISEFKPEGADEVRKAGFAFIMMKEKIEQQINQRTQMLAGVSHDLKTPITRMKLSLAMMPENEDTKALINDLDEMQSIISNYLDFASKVDLEKKQTVDLIELLTAIINKHKIGGEKVTFKNELKHCFISARPISLRRALSNVIENGIKYGDEVIVAISKTRSKIVIVIEDNGPGILPSEHEKVFSAFFRSDYARNMNDKKSQGTGLGLAIARDIFNSHGASIKVNKNPYYLQGASFEIQFRL